MTKKVTKIALISMSLLALSTSVGAVATQQAQAAKVSTPSFIKLNKPFKKHYFNAHYNKKGTLIRYYYSKKGVLHREEDYADGGVGDLVSADGFGRHKLPKIKKYVSNKPYKVRLTTTANVQRDIGSLKKGTIEIDGDNLKKGKIKKGTILEIAWCKPNNSWVVYQKHDNGYFWEFSDYVYRDRSWFKLIK